MAKRGRRLWLKGEAQGGPFHVYVSNEDIDYDGVKCKGFYTVLEGRPDEVTVSRKQGTAGIKQTLFHELMHKAFGTISGDLREHILGEKTPEGRAEREELLISFLEPVFYDLLARNGWLRFPDPPKRAPKSVESSSKGRRRS